MLHFTLFFARGLSSHQLKVLLCLAALWVTPCSTQMSGSDSQCRIHLTKPKYEYKYMQDGDIIIGGVFSINSALYYIPEHNGKHKPLCINPTESHYVDILSFLFIIEEINKDPDLLPNVTLGYHVYDSCGDPSLAIGSVLQILSGPGEPVPNYSCGDQGEIAGFIGDVSPVTSLPIAQLLSVYGYSQISYGATNPALSDRTLYPYYVSTGLNDHVQHVAIAELVEHLGWTWVIILVDDDDYEQSKNLRTEITKHNACVDFIAALTGDINTNRRTLEHIKQSTAEVIIFCGRVSRGRSLVSYLETIIQDKTLVVPAIWVSMLTLRLFNGSLLFAEARDFFEDNTEFNQFSLAITEDVLRNDLFSVQSSCLTHDKEKDRLFQKVYDKVYRNCPGLKWSDEGYPTLQVQRAVNGLARAEHIMLSSFGKYHKDIYKNIHKNKLHQYLRKVRFTEASGREIDFSNLINSPVKFQIFSWYCYLTFEIRQVYVGEYVWSGSERSLEIQIEKIFWKKNTNNQTLKSQCSANCPPGSRKVPRKTAPPCCYDCISCSEGEISNLTDMENCLKCQDYEWPNQEKTMCIEKQTEFLSYQDDPLTLAFIVLSVVFILITTVILGIFISFRDTPVVKANNRNLSFILLVSIKLSVLSVFLFLGRPMDITCMLRQTSFGITFSIAMSSVLSKTIMVCMAFKASKPDSPWRKYVSAKVAYWIVFVCSVIQILISVIWLASSPPFVEHNIHSEPGKILILCNEGSVVAFYIVLSYMGLLASVSFIVAFLARSLPDSFNEAKYITFSMLLFCSVWITMIPAYLSTKGKYMVAVEIFAIISSSCGLLFCIFLPKCYIILFKPEMNTKQYLLGSSK
uniref:G-protein coupled receptors family 3 profile domain-containing protein n=1 Tax=Xenopus tropicalis TaxID=8364 RepID=A0A803JL76_XENTR